MKMRMKVTMLSVGELRVNDDSNRTNEAAMPHRKNPLARRRRHPSP